LTLPCPSPVADATERELIESENPSPPAAPIEIDNNDKKKKKKGKK
jgi:hypothetical protein